MVRRLVLCGQRDHVAHYYEEASAQPDGGRVAGEEWGAQVQEFFGPGLEDHEWFYNHVPPERVRALMTALGGRPAITSWSCWPTTTTSTQSQT